MPVESALSTIVIEPSAILPTSWSDPVVWLTLIGILINSILILLNLWLALETRRMAKHSSEQLGITSRPYLTFSKSHINITPSYYEFIIELTNTGDVPAKYKWIYLKRDKESLPGSIERSCIYQGQTEHTALTIYDHTQTITAEIEYTDFLGFKKYKRICTWEIIDIPRKLKKIIENDGD